MDEKVFKLLLLEYILSTEDYTLICPEVPFLSAGRFVDMLHITKNNELIAYEIKSDRDSLARLEGQMKDYLETFDKLYLILSDKFREHVKTLPRNVGYGFIEDGKIVIKRQARARKRLSKLNLAMFLWRKDLRQYQTRKVQSVGEFRLFYLKEKTQDEVKQDAINAIKGRYSSIFCNFMEKKSTPVSHSDLTLLTRW